MCRCVTFRGNMPTLRQISRIATALILLLTIICQYTVLGLGLRPNFLTYLLLGLVLILVGLYPFPSLGKAYCW